MSIHEPDQKLWDWDQNFWRNFSSDLQKSQELVMKRSKMTIKNI